MSNIDPSGGRESWIEHREFVRALARRLLADDHAAEDVAQEACLAAFEAPPRSEAATRAWLARVVRNLSFNRLRERERRTRRERDVARPEAYEDAIDARIDTQKRVLVAVSALREPMKAAVWMRWFEGLPPREIARRTNVSVDTVKSRLQRGLAELERALDREFGDRKGWQCALAPFAGRRALIVTATPWLLAGGLALSILVTTIVAERNHAMGARAARHESVRDGSPSTLESSFTSDAVRVAVEPGEGSVSSRGLAGRTRAPDGAQATTPVQGPRFELDLRLQGGLAAHDFEASLELDGQEAPCAERQVARVEEGPMPVVQFDHAPRTSLLGGGARSTCTLAIESADGLWAASCRVLVPWEGEVERVQLEPSPRARLVGVVRGSDGRPVLGARVRLTGVASGRLRTTVTSAGGEWAFGGLEPGRYEVTARSNAHRPITSPVLVDALEERAVTVVFDAVATSVLDGRLSSRSGTHGPRGPVRIRSVEDPTFEFEVPAHPVDAGTWSFRCDALAPGTYEVFPPMEDCFAWSPASAVVSTPSAALTFVCRDDMPTGPVRLRAFDADTGLALQRFEAVLLLDRYDAGRLAALRIEPRSLRAEGVNGEAVFPSVPRVANGWWLVEAEGRASSWGSLSDLHRHGAALEDEVRLARAWSARFWVGTRDEFGMARPLANARFETCRGRLLSTSLDAGEAVLDLLFDPGRIQVVLPGWRVSGIEGFANGRRQQHRDLHRVWMIRE